jgi:hypothetical protein
MKDQKPRRLLSQGATQLDVLARSWNVVDRYRVHHATSAPGQAQ